jgi:hypothetical protein
MTKPWTPNRPTVELRAPSRIRRDPPPPPRGTRPEALPEGESDETWPVVMGILAFALAITFLIFWISDYTSADPNAPREEVRWVSES